MGVPLTERPDSHLLVQIPASLRLGAATVSGMLPAPHQARRVRIAGGVRHPYTV